MHDPYTAISDNRNPIFEVIETILKVQRQRNLSLFGRIYITGSLCISKLIYVLTVLPSIPESYFKTLNTTLFKYIWKNSNKKLRYGVNWPIGLQGTNMVDTKSLITTLHLKWIGRLWNDVGAPWKTWLEYYCVIPNIQHLLNVT